MSATSPRSGQSVEDCAHWPDRSRLNVLRWSKPPLSEALHLCGPRHLQINRSLCRFKPAGQDDPRRPIFEIEVPRARSRSAHIFLNESEPALGEGHDEFA